MPRHPRLNQNRSSVMLQFRFLCSFREDGGNSMRRKRFFFQTILLIAILIYLQILYKTSFHNCNERIGRIFTLNRKRPFRDEIPKFFLNRSFHYHQRLLSYERFMAMNYRFIDIGEKAPIYDEYTPICRLNLSSLGPIKVNKTRLSMKYVERVTQELKAGGFHAPRRCRSRHKVAILVPYRDRLENLAIFLYYMHRLLQKQLLQYRIFVIEQYGHADFNKGALYNIGYLETQRFGRWHCLIFHDVDLIPEHEQILYSCPRKPTHMSPAVESLSYKLWYTQLFGGVTAMTPQQFLKVNGYSNYYWNWGAEDDDMFIRLQASRLPVLRYNAEIARYASLPHKKSTMNRKRFASLSFAKARFRYEGLRTLEYKLLGINQSKLFTHILVDTNPFNHESPI